MCDGKRVDEIESTGVAAARACRVVSGVSSLGRWRVTRGERRIDEKVSWKGDSGRLERGRAEGPGKRKSWRGIGAELDDLLYRKRR